MSGESQQSSTKKTLKDLTFNGLGDLIKLLPTGTVFAFQFLSPLLTNNGNCHTLSKYLAGSLLFICSFLCCFSCFTDSYTGSDSRVYYGIVTRNGMCLFSDSNTSSKDLSTYKLRLGDFARAFLSLIVFAVVALLDSNIVSCFYPSLVFDEKKLLMFLPVAVGGLSSFVFMVFPDNRHGIGYPPMEARTDSE